MESSVGLSVVFVEFLVGFLINRKLGSRSHRCRRCLSRKLIERSIVQTPIGLDTAAYSYSPNWGDFEERTWLPQPRFCSGTAQQSTLIAFTVMGTCIWFFTGSEKPKALEPTISGGTLRVLTADQIRNSLLNDVFDLDYLCLLRIVTSFFAPAFKSSRADALGVLRR